MAENMRSFWKGSLRLSLVIIPVKLVSATRSDGKIAFHQVDRKTKQRIRYQKVIPSGKVVDKEDIVSGYEVKPGSYVLFEPDELDAVKLKTKHTIELTQFVDSCSIDPLYFEQPYYLLPDGDMAEEGYGVIREALRAEKKVGIGQLTIRGREELIALAPAGEGLMLQTLRYETEIKDADDVFKGIGRTKSRGDLVDMAKDLIRKRSGDFDPSDYHSHYAEALRTLVKEKLEKGRVVDVEGDDEKSSRGNVVDFMEALKRSVAEGGGKSSGRATAKDTDAPKAAKSKTRVAARAAASPAKRGSSKPARRAAR